ncbi:MAG: hypothetical protein ACMUHY_05420 [Thermoplasmatota archaeon]
MYSERDAEKGDPHHDVGVHRIEGSTVAKFPSRSSDLAGMHMRIKSSYPAFFNIGGVRNERNGELILDRDNIDWVIRIHDGLIR